MKVLFFTVFSIIFIFKNVNAQNLKIIDGDTIKFNGLKIRFSGIDAPETNFRGKSQKCFSGKKLVNCGELSKNFLIKITKKKKIVCILEQKPDNYNRKLGECFINNDSVSRILVKNGYAFDYPKYSNNKFLREQNYARKNKLGLWNMKFDYPWIFRSKISKN